MIRWMTLALALALAGGCGQSRRLCSAYHAARDAACQTCSALQAPCPFEQAKEDDD